MPLTFCHPVIVLPFKILPKRWFSMVGLITGSMTPDFEYFLPMQINEGIGHSIRGLLFFNLPVGIMLTYIFFYMVSKALIHNLPVYFKSRLIFITNINWNRYFIKNWYIVFPSILIGALSHIFLDAFTHYNGYFVLKFPALSMNVSFFSYSQPVYNILQYGGTLAGGLLILLYISRLNPVENTKQSDIISFWLKVISVGLIILAIRLWFGGFGKSILITSIITSIASGLYALVIVSLFYYESK